MPFRSERQRRWMHAHKPQMAARWERESKGNTVKAKPTPKGIMKRVARIKSKTGLSTSEAGKLAVKRATAYRSKLGPTPGPTKKDRPVPARPSLARAVAYAKKKRS